MGLTRWVSFGIPVGTPVPILRGPLRGYYWIAGAAAGGGKGLSIVLDRSEPEQLRAAQRWVDPGTVCFDIGANVGLYSLLFARKNATVIAFEPFPRNVEYLHRIVAINRVENVTIVPWAVGIEPGMRAFRQGETQASGHLSAAGEQPVFCTSLDAYVEQYGIEPDLLKIDVEGAELEVLQGARRLLEERMPRILLSIHGEDLRRDCLRLLREIGYTLVEPLDATDEETAREFAVC